MSTKRFPSVRTLDRAFGDALLRTYANLDEARKAPARLRQAMENAGSNGRAVSESMQAIDGLLGTHGVECIRGADWHPFWGDVTALYCNTGDAYDTTLLYDTRAGTFHVTSYGAWVEAEEKRKAV